MTLQCVGRDYGASSIVCVCNATYCDSLEPIDEERISGGNYLNYVSSKAGLRLEPNTGTLSGEVDDATAVVFTIDRNTTFQEILGFGGSLTDSTAFNIRNLSEDVSNNLLKTYFGEGGAQYLYLRVPMGASDFSLHFYSYDDVENDVALEHFDLIDIDYNYKIPIIKQASELRGEAINLFTTPWTSPAWMKDSNDYMSGSLLKTYYQPWANYFIKYFDAYARKNVSFWGLAPQNEPTVNKNNIPVMGWSAAQERDWVANYLGPTLVQAGYGGLKIMALDDNRNNLPDWVDVVLSDEAAAKYVSGIAVHWYRDTSTNDSVLEQTHEMHPDKFLFYTEACNHSKCYKTKVNVIRHLSQLFPPAPSWNHAENLGEAHRLHKAKSNRQTLDGAVVRVKTSDFGDWEIGEKYATSMMQPDWASERLKYKIDHMVVMRGGQTGASDRACVLKPVQSSLQALGNIISGKPFRKNHNQYTQPGWNPDFPVFRNLVYSDSSTLDYAASEAFNNWVSGWTDWNLAVNEDGGPATFGNKPDIFGYNAAIIVNSTGDEFYKQPPYYFQAHYSMFVPPGSVHIQLTSPNDGGLLHVAFLTPEDTVVVILFNNQDLAVPVVVRDPDLGDISLTVAERSINTVIYK
uniref:Glucosylceramidase n=1 Tax=Timema californicum TaxID=61474 RepID=A0A7R9JB36_TIMCA|nr:unnamed protein product [Timema californicum]